MTKETVEAALADLIERTLALTRDGLLSTPFDKNWRSDCEVRSTSKHSWWRPVPQVPRVDFSGLEHALEQPFHPDILAWYSTYWSGNLEARSDDGPVSLIQLWNQDDFERLRGNLIGHAMMKQRQQQPLTVFFATTDPDTEMFLSIECKTGEVLLEEPGRPVIRVVAHSLAKFLGTLKPVINHA